MTSKRPLLITTRDMERLQRLIDVYALGRDGHAFDALQDELARATVVDPTRIPSDVVTMNSRVVFEDEDTGQHKEVTLVYPQDADPSQKKVSVLAPVGMALLGLSVGQSIEWPLPGNRTTRLRIIAVKFQPESSGEGI